jgi:hypothetical protein
MGSLEGGPMRKIIGLGGFILVAAGLGALAMWMGHSSSSRLSLPMIADSRPPETRGVQVDPPGNMISLDTAAVSDAPGFEEARQERRAAFGAAEKAHTAALAANVAAEKAQERARAEASAAAKAREKALAADPADAKAREESSAADAASAEAREEALAADAAAAKAREEASIAYAKVRPIVMGLVEDKPPVAGSIAAAGRTLAQLPKGKIVLDAPAAMKVEETRSVHANVGINVPIETLRKYVRPGDQSVESALKISSEMTAILTGPGFKITRTTPEQQSVAEGFPTVWSWDVEAKQAGEQELEATLYVLLPSGDKASHQRIDSFTHKIGVTVREQTWREWLKSSKEEIEAIHVIAMMLGGAAMAAFGWLGWAYSRHRRNMHRSEVDSTAVT